MNAITAETVIKPTDIPATSQSTLRVVQACADPKVNVRKLADIVSSDPVLTAELLRIVNSAFYGLAREVTSISHSLAIIGQRALRNLVLCLSVRDSLKSDADSAFNGAEYMDEVLLRAVCARVLGEFLKVDPHECFTAGIMQDFGLMVMFHKSPENEIYWPKFKIADPEMRYSLEKEHFNITHDQIGQILSEQWSLPDEIAAVMSYHHTLPAELNDQDTVTLCKIAQCADWMAAVFTSDTKKSAINCYHKLLSDNFDIDEIQCEKLLELASSNMEETATSLGINVNEKIDFEEVMQEANKRLAEETVNYQELVWKLEKTITERDRLSKIIQKELEIAREIQQGLLPNRNNINPYMTGINISAKEVSGDFYDYFTLEDGRIYFNIADVSGKGMPAALLMVKACSLFRFLAKSIIDPALLMTMINNEIIETMIRGMFVTMVGGIYDPESDRVRIVNAGHEPPLLISKDGKSEVIQGEAPPLGINPKAVFNETTINLDGGGLYLYTDGLTECKRKDKGIINKDILQTVFCKLAKVNPDKRLEALINNLKISEDNIADDLTMLIIEKPD